MGNITFTMIKPEAVEAKKEADRALAEEYKALGISSLSYNRGFFL